MKNKKLGIFLILLFSAVVAVSATLVDISADFSGVQGENGLYYGAVSNGNYNANWFSAWDSWDEFVDFNAPFRWRDRVVTADNYRYTAQDELSAYDDQGAGVYWEADKSYRNVTVMAGRIGGTAYNTHVLWWDASAETGYDLNTGYKQQSGIYTVGDVDLGDKIVIVVHAGGATQMKVQYEFSVAGSPTGSMALIVTGNKK